MKILKNLKIFKNMRIDREIIREKKVKRTRGDAFSTSYPSGNRVGGLPLVAILTRGELVWTNDLGNLVHWTSKLEFN